VSRRGLSIDAPTPEIDPAQIDPVYPDVGLKYLVGVGAYDEMLPIDHACMCEDPSLDHSPPGPSAPKRGAGP
jgi:hypothetical protein